MKQALDPIGPWLSRPRLTLWIVLLPLSWIWACVALVRRALYPASQQGRPGVAVLSVGNIHSGGSGKTPIVVEIARRFSSWQPVILSRGYLGRLSRAGAWVDPSSPDGPAAFGDEPWMLAKRTGAQVVIGRNRKKMIREIEQRLSPRLVILDDGFQYLKLARKLDLVCINTDKPLQAAFCLPLGELREPLSALRAAQAVVLTGSHRSQAWRDWVAAVAPGIPRFEAKRRVEGLWRGAEPSQAQDGSSGWAAFAAIADPFGFLRDLQSFFSAEGRHLLFFEPLRDHHPYDAVTVSRLLRKAKTRAREAVPWVTTEKDWYKAAPSFQAAGERLNYLRIAYEFSDEFWYFVERSLG